MTRFTISGVVEGPLDLREQLPVTARTVDVRRGPDGHTYFCAHLDKPIKYYVDASTPADSMAEESDESDDDSYVLVSEIVMRSTDPAVHPHRGMQRFPVEVAYVTDPSYNDAEELDFSKIVPVAAAEIDGLDEESTLIFSRPVLDDEPSSGQQDSTLAEGGDAEHHDGFVDDLPTSVGIVLPPSVRLDLEQSGNAGPLLPVSSDAVELELEHAASTEATGFDYPESAGVRPLAGYSKPALTPLTYAHRGPSKRMLAVGAAAAVAIIIVAITVWSSLTTDSGGSGPVGTSSSVAPAPPEVDMKRLKSSLPKGYSDDSCAMNVDGAVPSVACGPNADAAGPQKGTYAAPPNPQSLRSAFNDAIAHFGRVACPGNLQSPGPWHRGGKVEGALFCGTTEGQAVIVWTNDVRSLLYVVQAGPQAGAPSLEQLYVWWTQHA